MLEQLNDLRLYANGIDDLECVELHPKFKTMEELQETLDSEFQKYQSRLEEEQKYLEDTIKDYEFELSHIMMIEESEERKKEFIQLCEKIDLNSIMDNLNDVIKDMEEVKTCIDSLDNMIYSNNGSKEEILNIVDKLESNENWKLYDSLK